MLLDADLAALSTDHASPLGAHVANCARCRAIVITLQADTSRLAALAVAHPAPPARTGNTVRRRMPWLAPIPLAATLLLAYVGLSRMTPKAVDLPPATTARKANPPDLADAVPAARVVPRRPSRNAPASVRRLASASTTADLDESRRSTPTRIEVGGPTVAESVTPKLVAYDGDLNGVELAMADVSTSSGRVVVLRPGNTKITVVWFY
jgi:hypothetical protein